MSPSRSVADPVSEAIARASSGLSPADSKTFEKAVRTGLRQLGEAAPPEALAEEVKQAESIPAGQRVQWATDFAARQEVRRLSRTAWNLLEQLKAGAAGGDLQEKAAALLDEAHSFDQGRLKSAGLSELRLELGDVELESRYIMSGGKGPISLRAGKLIK